MGSWPPTSSIASCRRADPPVGLHRPVPVRYQLGFDAGLTRGVLRVFLRDVLLGQSHGHTSDLNLNPTHSHSQAVTVPADTAAGSYYLVKADRWMPHTLGSVARCGGCWPSAMTSAIVNHGFASGCGHPI